MRLESIELIAVVATKDGKPFDKVALVPIFNAAQDTFHVDQLRFTGPLPA